jgi:hypothetical protein
MRKIIQAAGLLLALQIVVAVALNMSGSSNMEVAPDTPLFGFKAEAVTALTISDGENKTITIAKGDQGWVLPETSNAPANNDQVTALLEKLAGLKQGLPVATSGDSAKRFKVADDLFQRRVEVKEGDAVVADLYVGTSPGFRQIHARKAGSSEVLIAALSTFELETASDQWLDKGMFAVREEDLEGMLFPGFTLTRSGKEWQLDNLAGEEKTDSKAAADLAARVSGLTVQSVVEAETAAPLFAGEPALRFSVKKEGGAQIDYLLAKGDEETYYLKQSERAQYGKVHKLQAEGLLKAGREALIAKPEEPGASGNDKVEGDTGGK